jgi:hypothetical protein
MNGLNAVLREVVSGILWFFSGCSPLAVLLLVSVGLGIVMAIVFRFTSNQRKLRRLADLSRAEVLAIRLFKDEPATMVYALGRLLRHSANRFWYSLPPMLVMLVPFVLLMTHLSLWYEYRPLQVGETAVVELQLADDAWTRYQSITPEVPDALAIETSSLRDDQEKSVWWRIQVRQPETTVMHWKIGAQQIAKEVAIANDNAAFMPVSSRRAGPGWWDQILNPGEDSLAASSPIRSITIYHEHRSTPIMGWDFPWWLTLIVVSIVAALVMRPFVRVQF